MLFARSGVKSGAIVSYAYTFVNSIVSIIYVPLLLSSIGREEYGLYQLIGSIMAYIVSINGILASGVGRYYCMYKAEDDQTKMENTLAIAKRMYWALSVVTVAVILIVSMAFRTIYSTSFSQALVDEGSAMLLVLGVNCIVVMNNAITIAAITANERFVFLKGTQLVSLVVQPVIVVAVAQLVPSAIVVSIVALLTNIVCASVQRVYARHILHIRYTFHGWDRALAHGILGFSVAIILVTLADLIFWKTDQLIVGYLFGADSVAVYSIGAQIYQAYMNIGIAASSVFLPRVSQLYHGNHDMAAISALFIKVGRISLMICLLILGAFTFLGPDFMALWAGDNCFDSYLVAIIVMVPFTIDLIQNLGLTILQVIDKYYFRGAMYLVIALLNVVLTVVMLNAVGLAGAALSTAIAMLIGNGFIMNWFYKFKVGLDITNFWRQMLPIAIPVSLLVAVFACVYWLAPIPHASWFAFIAAGVFWVVGYVSILWRFSMNDYEKGLVRSVLHKH